MDLNSLLKVDLLAVADELGLELSKAIRKPEIVGKISACGASADEIAEAVDEVQRKRKVREREEELKQCQLEQLKRSLTTEAEPRAVNYDMRGFLQPFVIGSELGLFLTNFERTCTRMGFELTSWPQRLLSLLPAEAAEILARLNAEEAECYQDVKRALLAKYKLSPEAFRLKFRKSVKKPNESYSEFAYRLASFQENWLKGADAFEDKAKMFEEICLEQFCSTLPEKLREWILDKPDVRTARKAAEYADDYCAKRRSFDAERNMRGARGSTAEQKEFRKSEKKDNNTTKQESLDSQLNQSFEARKPIVCFKCQKPGHVAAGCRVPKVSPIQFVMGHGEDLLQPYLHDMEVNGRECKVLRDTGATYDVVHSSLVNSGDFTGDYVCLRQALEEGTLSLPVANVTLKGAFGEIKTEAAVSDNVMPQCPYLLSNRTAKELLNAGVTLDMNPVMVVTRSMAKETAAHQEPSSRVVSAEDQKRGQSDNGDEASSDTHESAHEEGEQAPCFIPPTSCDFQALSTVDKATLIEEQKTDLTLTKCRQSVAKQGAGSGSFHERNGVLYRDFRGKKGASADQIVVPLKYRENILELSHRAGWSGHLGITKTKARLLSEYYWPGCFKDVEEFVRSCDVCQRTGRPHEKHKAPMTAVPIITEPFRRVVVDIVGPLPVTKSGYKYLLTMVCPATKFPEAMPLRCLASAEIVDALLLIFSRVGFPSEIQSDLGSVFTSELTTTFLNRCGIKIHHSSIQHPQSNSVERVHSVMKRVLRALCYDKKNRMGCRVTSYAFCLTFGGTCIDRF